MKTYLKIKRLFDIIISSSSIIMLSPIYFIIAVTVKITSEGPIIFKQKRIGHNQKMFTLYKFRTMVKNAEQLKEKYRHLNEADGPVFKIANDPRFTKIGRFLSKTNLDELPQFLNVLKGDISIVGYRAPTPDEVKKYERWHFERFKGIPGMTSLWAISGNHNKFKFDEWIKMDIDYNNNPSFLIDLKIIGTTGINMIKNLIKK